MRQCRSSTGAILTSIVVWPFEFFLVSSFQKRGDIAYLRGCTRRKRFFVPFWFCIAWVPFLRCDPLAPMKYRLPDTINLKI